MAIALPTLSSFFSPPLIPMQRPSRFCFLYLCLFTGIILLTGGSSGPAILKKRYQIENNSSIFLKGTSTVNEFTCKCEERFGEQQVEAEQTDNHARFKNTELWVPIKKFNCKNSRIDADMQRALQAEKYPHIKITLIDCWQNNKCMNGRCADWFDVKANISISLSGATRKEIITARAKAIATNKFQLIGEKAVQMSSFGVTPPEAMFGMIKVNDWISLHFDLMVSLID